MDAISTENLSKSFGGVCAVDALTLRVPRGELFGLVGPDGAGKTTTMRMLAGVMTPTSGDALVLGHSVRDAAEAVKADIGYMSQRFGLYPDLTVMENLSFYADLYRVPRRERGEHITRLLDFSRLAPFKDRLAGRLSGGMKQKLGLACALVHTPKLLLLDEPTNGVDPVSRREFWRILYDLLGEGVAIFVSTAYLDEAERCGRLALMHQGKLLAYGTPESIKQGYDGLLLALQCDRIQEAMSGLRAAGCAAGLFGERIHIPTRDESATRALVEHVCAEAGIAAYRLEAIDPSLEDVFVHMLHPDGAEAAP